MEIAIISVILSSVISIASVVIVILTIRQNNKMIEESTRPYISFYTDFTYIQNTRQYLILKNFGKSGATITSFETNIDLSEYMPDIPGIVKKKRPFSNIIGSTIAPQQSICAIIDNLKVKGEKNELIIDIEYKNLGRKYSENIIVKLNSHHEIMKQRISTENNELWVIAHSLEEITERLL